LKEQTQIDNTQSTPGTISEDKKVGFNRPGSISSSLPSNKKDSSNTARSVIHDISGVGADLRSASRPVPQSGTAFLKPAGVDEPAGRPASPGVGPKSKLKTPDPKVKGTTNSGKTKVKRERDAPPDGEGKRRKKKKSD
jgi:hypothetical protein